MSAQKLQEAIDLYRDEHGRLAFTAGRIPAEARPLLRKRLSALPHQPEKRTSDLDRGYGQTLPVQQPE